MTDFHWTIPPSVLQHLESVPRDRAVVLLLRHSVRDALPAGHAGYVLPITEAGRRIALELGTHLRGRLRTLHASPLHRCVQTAEAIAEGASVDLAVQPNRLLGDPGVFVIDDRLAGLQWDTLGHETVMRHLVVETETLPGLARAEEAARFLVQAMLGTAANRPGIHLFVTHDSLVTATAARLLGQPFGPGDWPWYLEGAFFWATEAGVHTAYRHHEAMRPGALSGFAESEVIEFARREIAATVGLGSSARFYLAGGAFKTLLTGRAPRDLDIWAPSDRDRSLLIDTLCARGARPVAPQPFADAFELAGRVIEIPHKTKPRTQEARLARFDIGLSAVGVEHLPGGEWLARVNPLAMESVRRREVMLLKPLANQRYALTTLERMRRYAQELDFSVNPDDEEEIWRVFGSQGAEEQAAMIDSYQHSGTGRFGVAEELAHRRR